MLIPTDQPRYRLQDASSPNHNDKSFSKYTLWVLLTFLMLETMQKIRNESDHPGLKKHPKTCEKLQILILVNLLWFWDDFSANDDRIHF